MSLQAQRYFDAIRELYGRHADPALAIPMKRYLKNRFEFFGIKTPERRALSRQLITAYGIPPADELKDLCRLCFLAPERECQYFVCDVLYHARRQLDASFIDLIEELIPQKSWWDTIDFLAPKLAGALFLRHSGLIGPYTGRWIASENIWFQRSAILFQLGYKQGTDAGLLFAYIRQRADSREFFIRKAAGWALREYSKTNPEAVIRFVEETPLPGLTRREALKWLQGKGRL